jgi:hypothetical protein
VKKRLQLQTEMWLVGAKSAYSVRASRQEENGLHSRGQEKQGRDTAKKEGLGGEMRDG